MAIPSPDKPAASAASLSPEVTISIADGVQQVSAGQMVRYQVVVRNSGTAEAPLTIKLTVPGRAVTGLRAEEAAVVANAVAWKNVVSPGESRTYSLSGRIEPETRQRELAVTACVHERPGAPAVACATDLNELFAAGPDDGGARRFAWIGAIAFGILAAIGALWLYRKVNPEPLTPATVQEAALPAAPVSSQPGGAPSA